MSATYPLFFKGVTELLVRLRACNPEIGAYCGHALNELGAITVRLSNGSIDISFQTVQDQEMIPQCVPEKWIAELANGFKKASSPLDSVESTAGAEGKTIL